MMPPSTISRRRAHASQPSLAASALGGVPENVVPYDYGASFEITGTPGAIRQDVINVSPDGVFVAVAIGYGFEEDRARSVEIALAPRPRQPGAPPVVPAEIIPGDITLGEIPAAALVEGIRVNPQFGAFVFADAGDPSEPRGSGGELGLAEQPLPARFAVEGDGRRGTLFQRVRRPAQLSFLLSLMDSASGRELQDEPAHNLAALGKSDGQRPFRWLARPVTFMPRSTVRLQIVERSEGVRGTLQIVLYGYKVLGGAGCGPRATDGRGGPSAAASQGLERPSDRVIPFDYVTTFPLTGRPGNQLEAEATVNVEGGFVAASVGYSLLVEQTDVAVDLSQAGQAVRPPPPALPATVDLAAVPLRALPPGALADGFRLRPDLVRIAFQNNGRLSADLPVSWCGSLFERLNRVEDVSFRYTIYDGGRGRDLQNIPLHNIAGLGIATGERPFKKLARPLGFLPRSTIRVRVEERFGRGTLFIVFHGYKVLGAPGGNR